MVAVKGYQSVQPNWERMRGIEKGDLGVFIGVFVLAYIVLVARIMPR